MKIWLTRHGQTRLNKAHLMQGRTDEPLNETGIAQAKAMRQILINEDSSLVFDAVYASPLDRAIETGAIIGGVSREDVLIDERLIETDFGRYEKSRYYALGVAMSLYWAINSLVTIGKTLIVQKIIDDKNAVLEAMFSLSAILSHLLIKYDAVYYYAHKSVLAHGKRWHSDHEKWLGIFDRLCANPFMDKLQDFFFLELGMSQRDSSEALSAVFFALTNERVKVLDNMVLIEQCDKAHDYYALMSAMNGEAIDQLKKQTLQLPEGYRSTVLPALEKKQKEFAIA